MKKLWLVALIVFIFDQLSKIFFTGKEFFIFKYAENYGAAFSLFNGGRWFFIFVAIALIFFIWHYRKKINKNLQIPLGLLVGGALGNTYDRLFFGFVRDFIDLGFWPVFNIADIANCIAVVLIIYYTWKE